MFYLLYMRLQVPIVLIADTVFSSAFAVILVAIWHPHPFLWWFCASKLQIHRVNIADRNAKIVYKMVAIKNATSKNAKVTTKNIAKKTAATAMGQLSIFSNTEASMIVAIGKANSISRRFIGNLSSSINLLYYMPIFLNMLLWWVYDILYIFFIFYGICDIFKCFLVLWYSS